MPVQYTVTYNAFSNFVSYQTDLADHPTLTTFKFLNCVVHCRFT